MAAAWKLVTLRVSNKVQGQHAGPPLRMQTSNLVDQSQLVKPEGLFSSRNWQHEKRNASMSYDVCVMWQMHVTILARRWKHSWIWDRCSKTSGTLKISMLYKSKKMQARASRKKIMCMKSLAISWTVAGEQRHFLRKITLPNGSLVHELLTAACSSRKTPPNLRGNRFVNRRKQHGRCWGFSFLWFHGRPKFQWRKFHILGICFHWNVYNKFNSIPASTVMDWIRRKQGSEGWPTFCTSPPVNVDCNMFPCATSSGTQIKTRSRPVMMCSCQWCPSPVLCCFLISPVFTTETRKILRLNMVWTYCPTVNQSYVDLKSGTMFEPPWLLLHPLHPRVSW